MLLNQPKIGSIDDDKIDNFTAFRIDCAIKVIWRVMKTGSNKCKVLIDLNPSSLYYVMLSIFKSAPFIVDLLRRF